MSAYIVDENHIHALVAAAYTWDLYWYHDGTPTHARHRDSDALGFMLWNENLLSIKYRYPDCGPNDRPGPIVDEEGGIDAVIEHYSYSPFAVSLSPVAILKAINGYEYQSCEHPEWERSEAKTFCDYLKGEAISRLPGYAEASWEVTSDKVSA